CLWAGWNRVHPALLVRKRTSTPRAKAPSPFASRSTRWYDVRSSRGLPLRLQSPMRGRSSSGPIPTLTTSFEKRTTSFPRFPTWRKILAGLRVTRSGRRSREAPVLPAALGSRRAGARSSAASRGSNGASLAAVFADDAVEEAAKGGPGHEIHRQLLKQPPGSFFE